MLVADIHFGDADDADDADGISRLADGTRAAERGGEQDVHRDCAASDVD
jgi:hypothetical protein